MPQDSVTSQLANCVSRRKEAHRRAWLTPVWEETSQSRSIELGDTVFRVTDCLSKEVCLFPASRAMVALTSKHFERLLFGEMKESAQSRIPIEIEGVTVRGFSFLLALIYGFEGELLLNERNCLDVLQCADFFCESDLRDVCLEKLRELLIKQDDGEAKIEIMNRLKSSNMLELEPVKEIVDSSLARRDFAIDVFHSDAFEKCIPELVLDIVSSDKGTLYSEEELWMKLVKWARWQYRNHGEDAAECLVELINSREHSSNNEDGVRAFANHKEIVAKERFNDHRDALAPLTPFVRFPDMNGVFFSDHVVPLEILHHKVVTSVFAQLVGSTLQTSPFSSKKRRKVIDSNIMSWREIRALTTKAFGHDLEPTLDLLYRASAHGFSANTFHELCDNKGPTLTVVKTEFGHVIGAYSTQRFRSVRDNFVGDDTTFFFISRASLATKRLLGRSSLPIVVRSPRQKYGIIGYSCSGPFFGRGIRLLIGDSNQVSCCSVDSNNNLSTDHMPVYGSWFVGHRHDCSNDDVTFSVSEYEVFELR